MWERELFWIAMANMRYKGREKLVGDVTVYRVVVGNQWKGQR